MIYHRTVSSVLTACLTEGAHRKLAHGLRPGGTGSFVATPPEATVNIAVGLGLAAVAACRMLSPLRTR